MVLGSTQSNCSIKDNKENAIFKPLRNNDNARRLRSRPLNGPSPAVIAREAARDPRRRAHTPLVSAESRKTVKTPIDQADVSMDDLSAHPAPSGPQPSIQLPKRLGRAAFREISPAALEAVDPELKDVPLQYILDNLRPVGNQMLAVATSAVAHPPKDRLPRELEVLINDFSSDPPTHLLAIYSKTSPRVCLYPAHSLVFAAHCAHLPPLPPSPEFTSESSNPLTLPVVPICLPNPGSFPILMHYLYTKRPDHLLGSLLPLPTAPGAAVQGPAQLAQHLAATFTAQELLTHTLRVHGLWTNVVALGVFDKDLSKGIDMVWETLLEALALTGGAQWNEKNEA